MEVKVDQRIVDQFDNVQIGVLVVKGLTNDYKNNYDEIDQLLKTAEKSVNDHFKDQEITQDETIIRWRGIYSQFGAKPSKFRCSIESLCRMVTSEKNDYQIRRINPLVDIYNYISLKHRIPVGGDDTDKVEGYIWLTVADGTEEFSVLNSGEKEFACEKEVIYRDEKEVLCRRWNWRESNKTKLDETTKNVCLFIEGVSVYSEEDMREILGEMAELVGKYCGGEASISVLNSKNLKLEI